jgi:crossover junction endodeoxyribonuclease RuvC
MIEAMRKRGHAPTDDNEADALALLHCVLDREVA